jgi:hypothetical protein
VSRWTSWWKFIVKWREVDALLSRIDEHVDAVREASEKMVRVLPADLSYSPDRLILWFCDYLIREKVLDSFSEAGGLIRGFFAWFDGEAEVDREGMVVRVFTTIAAAAAWVLGEVRRVAAQYDQDATVRVYLRDDAIVFDAVTLAYEVREFAVDDGGVDA